ncbi:DsrE family protein [Candidatus Bathyarchaeota archaeon]|nr:DsrE family protein [Candidatus Bathyarchaeota archaeon]
MSEFVQFIAIYFGLLPGISFFPRIASHAFNFFPSKCATMYEEKLFVIVADGDPKVQSHLVFMYAKNAMKRGYMDQVRLVFWGPAQETIVRDTRLQDELKKVQAAGVETMACVSCSDDLGVTGQLESMGISPVRMGSILTEMLKAGWYQLTF